MTDLLRVEDLHCGYGGVSVLRGIDLAVPEAGTCVAIMGANGAGKTTLLRTLYGFIKPASGHVLYKGRNLARVAPHARRHMGIGFVQEGHRIFPRQTVRANLELGGYVSGLRGPALGARLKEMFGLFPMLEPKADDLGGSLSGGQQQMLALAQGLVNPPALLLIDEPSLGLSPGALEELYVHIGKLKSQGISTILAEQAVGMALGVADLVYVLDGGRVISHGSPDAVGGHAAIRQLYFSGGAES